ncbi:Retrotransposon gag domain [Sesbania bispinosa]|nr:Retrotransposon gag domain [Sesbania bispinosa]
METHLQARVEATESRLVSAETKVHDLLQEFGTLQETVAKEQHEQSEFRVLFEKFQKDQGRYSSGGGEDNGSSGSNPQRMEIDNDARIITKRVKLPQFDGVDSRGWYAWMALRYNWFTILLEVYPELTWDHFKVELMERFSGLEVQNPYEELAAIRQRGSVQEYIEEFEALAALVPRQPEQQYAMQLARNLELALYKGGECALRSSMVRANASHWASVGRGPSKFKEGGVFVPQISKGEHSVSEVKKQRERGFHNLTSKEWEERRKKGVVFPMWTAVWALAQVSQSEVEGGDFGRG